MGCLAERVNRSVARVVATPLATVLLLVPGAGDRTQAGSADTTSASAAGSEEPIRIGAVVPLTGVYGAVGVAAADGMEIAVNEINEAGGVLGREIELLVRDDQSDAQKTVLAVRELLESGVEFMIPGVIGNSALAALPFTTEAHVPTMTSPSNPALADAVAYPYNFALTVPYDLNLPAFAAVFEALGVERVGIFVQDTSSGEASGSTFESGLPELGFDVVARAAFAADANDVTPQLQEIRSADPDAIFTSAPGETLGLVMRGIRDLGWEVPVLGDVGSITGDVPALVPSEVAEQFSAVVWRVLRRAEPDQVDERFRPFVERLEEDGGDIVNLQVPALHRDMIYLATWAMEEAGSSTEDDVKAALESLHQADAAELPELLVFQNPAFSAEEHSIRGADLSDFWAVVSVSERVGGTYLGDELTLSS